MILTQIRARIAGVVILGLGALGAAPAAFAQDQTEPSQVAVGSPDAPVTVVEYFSFNCPLCAQFHMETMPQIFSKYIETGKVRFVFRDFPQDTLALSAAMVLRCVSGPLYFGFVQMLYKQQPNWSSAADPVAAVGKLGRIAGLSEDRVAACLSDRATGDAIVADQNRASRELQISVPPTFEIGGELIAGVLSFAEFEDIVERLLN